MAPPSFDNPRHMATKSSKQAPARFEDPSNSIGYLTRITFRSFSRALEKRTLPHGVSSGQWRFLRVLWTEDGLTQRELSRRVGMREPTTVAAVKSLQKAGFVVRRKDTSDRRKIYIFLTARAKTLKSRLMPHVAEVNAIAAQGLADAEVERVREALLRMIDNLAGENDTAPRAAPRPNPFAESG